MKKTNLLFGIAAALCLSTVVACGTNNEAGKTESNNSGSETETTTATTPIPGLPELPAEEGKLTLAFTLGASCVEIHSYESIYITGGSFGWKTGKEATALTRLGTTRKYYTQIATPDTTVNEWDQFQLVLGYNETSGKEDAKLGLQWNDDYKSDITKSGNGTFAIPEEGQIVDLGYIVFDKNLKDPAEPEVAACDITVKLVNSGTEAMGEGLVPHLIGENLGVDKWAGLLEMTKVDDNNYTVTIADVKEFINFKVVIPNDAGGPNWDAQVGLANDGTEPENFKVDNLTGEDITATITFDFAEFGTGKLQAELTRTPEVPAAPAE